MALPTNRDEFKDFCLRQIGQGAINIDITDEQAEDCVDMALLFYRDYAFDGSEKLYYKHQVTDADKTRGYITVPENIFGAVRVFPITQGLTSGDALFSIQFQFAMSEIMVLNQATMIPYFSARQHLELIQEVLVGQIPIRYNRHSNKLYLDFDWSKIESGNYLLVEAYGVLDPEVYTDIWSDRWLIRYCQALLKRQWGSNLIKFVGVPLPGSMQFNGDQIYRDAVNEVDKIETEAFDMIVMPPEMRMG